MHGTVLGDTSHARMTNTIIEIEPALGLQIQCEAQRGISHMPFPVGRIAELRTSAVEVTYKGPSLGREMRPCMASNGESLLSFGAGIGYGSASPTTTCSPQTRHGKFEKGNFSDCRRQPKQQDDAMCNGERRGITKKPSPAGRMVSLSFSACRRHWHGAVFLDGCRVKMMENYEQNARVAMCYSFWVSSTKWIYRQILLTPRFSRGEESQPGSCRSVHDLLRGCDHIGDGCASSRKLISTSLATDCNYDANQTTVDVWEQMESWAVRSLCLHGCLA